MKDLHFLTLTETAELIRTGKISPVAVTEACLGRVERLNSRLNAFIIVLANEARAAALDAEQEIKSGNYRGPLHGIPVAFKDMYDTAGVKTTAAFEYFKDRTPQKDAIAVQKLKAAGAILIGKTNMHELAMGTTSAVSFFGAVKEAQALSPQNTFLANYFGLPAISVPCGFTSNGLPTGLQLMGKPGEDATLLRVAKSFEDATEWTKKHPPCHIEP
ncbi:MAG: hypothetical protein JNM27_23125 [Leptospirales bacterium]|nr:hypothetical protein [Leptospirales bacterium]